MNCDSCDYFFSDNDSFNIHLKNCKDNINTDPKNKYYCPSCDKKFRILPNLEKHNESKKHLNLFEWNKKQLNINTNNQTTKFINLISEIEEKEPQQKHQQNSLEQLIKNRELELQSYKIPTQQTQPYDTPIQSHNTPIQQIQTIQPTQSHNTHIQSYTPLQNKIEEDDDDLSEEIKLTKLSLNLSIDLHQKEIEKVENQYNDDNFLDNIQEQRTIILKQIEESQTTPQQTPIKTVQQQTPIKTVQQQPSIKTVQQQPPIKTVQQQSPIKTVQQPQSKPKYPIEFKNTPIWKNMVSLINNNTKKEDDDKLVIMIITSLTKSPLNVYPYICAFIMCSEDLDNKPELRAKLINGLIEVKKAFAKLISLKKLYWNGVNTYDGYTLMNKLNLQEIKA
jgi:thiol-disulfide isomerase/thioredoxin